LERARDIIVQHPDLTILVRDEDSLGIATNELGAKAALCPDMAFNCSLFNLSLKPSVPYIWLYRNDKESVSNSEPPYKDGAWLYDWQTDEVTNLTKINTILLYHYLNEDDPARKEVMRKSLSNIYPHLANERVMRGCNILARGHYVVTERLHGHILCLLLGIPHYIIDTRFRKIRNFVESWDYSSPLVHWCDSQEEALSLTTG
jgi:pyruvyl transferase EpsO